MRPEPRKWTEKDEQRLARLAAKNHSPKLIARLMGRTPAAIQVRASALGIKFGQWNGKHNKRRDEGEELAPPNDAALAQVRPQDANTSHELKRTCRVLRWGI